MGNIIKLKHGLSVPIPDNLEQYELGYAQRGLYIKDESNQILKLSFNTLENNTIPEDDVPELWAKLGNCIIIYTSKPADFDFPSDTGMLIQFSDYEGGNNCVQQIWIRKDFGQIFNRAGSYITWESIGTMTWERVYTSRDVIPIVNGGTDASTAIDACNNLGAARVKAPNNLIHNGNEFTFIPSEYTGELWLNYRTQGGTNGALSQYTFGNGAGDLANGKFNNILLSAHGVTAQIGPQNSTATHFASPVPFYFNNNVIFRGTVNPNANNTYDIGTKTDRWKYVYAKGFAAPNGDGVWLSDTTGKEYKSLYVATDDGSYFQGPGTMYFRSNLNSSSYQGHWIRLFREQSGSYRTVFRPNVNSTAYLGTTSERWNTAFFTNAITASDLKEKDVIEDFDFKAEEFILGLKPIAYRRKGEGDGGKRIHLGFGAQDVAKTIDDLEMGNLSIVQASVVEEEPVEHENDNGEVEIVTERVEKPYDGSSIDDEKLSWGLNYNELIAPMVLMIQKQEERIKKLEILIDNNNYITQ